MKKSTRLIAFCAALVAAVALGLSGCGVMQAKPKKVAKKVAAKPKTFVCAPKGHLVRAVAPEAKLVEFSCFFKKYKKVKSLHFKVKIKNVSKVPQRYRVNIFLENGKAVGGLIPRKGKPPVVKPGQVVSFVYPVKGMSTKPKGVTLIIKTMSR